MLSSHVARRYGNAGLPQDTIKVSFKGIAGQSFGAFLASGVTFVLDGEANDYVGKGLSGGRIIIRRPAAADYPCDKNVIAGNVIGYGATGGTAYVYDELGDFDMRCNLAEIDLENIAENSPDESELKGLVEEFQQATGSARAKALLDNWENELPKFVKVFPVEYRKVLGKMVSGDEKKNSTESA